MKKETWKIHIETLSGLKRPSSYSVNERKDALIAWRQFLNNHCQNCKDCMKRKAQQRKNLYQREKNHALRTLTGTSARQAKIDMGL